MALAFCDKKNKSDVRGGNSDEWNLNSRMCIHLHFVLDSFNLRKVPNIVYCDICSLQPMEIYVDDEAKLTLHGLVQVIFVEI